LEWDGKKKKVVVGTMSGRIDGGGGIGQTRTRIYSGGEKRIEIR
jgi:hypothetical protein